MTFINRKGGVMKRENDLKEQEIIKNKKVSEMTPEERRRRLELVIEKVIERNGDALTKLSKN